MKEAYSFHIFSLPFKWDYHNNSARKASSFWERTELDDFDSLLPKGTWAKEYGSFSEEEWSKYNETAYFHPFARKAVFDEGGKGSIRRYRYLLAGEATYVIKPYFENQDEQQAYRLDIVKIGLAVFDTGVGVLSFFLENTQHADQASVYAINQLGRRLYVPFLDGEGKTTKAKEYKEIPDHIRIEGLRNGTITDDFQPSLAFPVPRFILPLFGNGFAASPTDEKIVVRPVVDDRMFVTCQLRDGNVSSRWAEWLPDQQEYRFLSDPSWHEYVFVDSLGGNTCQSKAMLKELMAKHTYHRWAGYGTLYGITRYSLVSTTDQGGFSFVLKDHLFGMYHQMVLLALAQRASILRFSEEVANIPQLKDSGKETVRIRSLYVEYMDFRNKLCFREISAQEQGIEMYGKMLEVANIDEDLARLDKAIEDLYNYANLLEQEVSSSRLNQLSLMGGVFLLPSFIMSWLGMKFFESGVADQAKRLWAFTPLLLAFSATILLFWHLYSQKPKRWPHWQLVVVALLSIAAIAVTIFKLL